MTGLYGDGKLAPIGRTQSRQLIQVLGAPLASRQASGAYITQSAADVRYASMNHTHVQSQVEGLIAALAARPIKEINDQLYAPLSHGHAIADVTGLQAALDARITQSAADVRYAPTSHAHAQSQVEGLIAALAARPIKEINDQLYAPLSHGHAIADVTSLQAALDGKAAASHDHTTDNLSSPYQAGSLLMSPMAGATVSAVVPPYGQPGGLLRWSYTGWSFDGTSYAPASHGHDYQPVENQRLSTGNNVAFAMVTVGSGARIAETSGNMSLQVGGNPKLVLRPTDVLSIVPLLPNSDGLALGAVGGAWAATLSSLRMPTLSTAGAMLRTLDADGNVGQSGLVDNGSVIYSTRTLRSNLDLLFATSANDIFPSMFQKTSSMGYHTTTMDIRGPNASLSIRVMQSDLATMEERFRVDTVDSSFKGSLNVETLNVSKRIHRSKAGFSAVLTDQEGDSRTNIAQDIPVAVLAPGTQTQYRNYNMPPENDGDEIAIVFGAYASVAAPRVYAYGAGGRIISRDGDVVATNASPYYGWGIRRYQCVGSDWYEI